MTKAWEDSLTRIWLWTLAPCCLVGGTWLADTILAERGCANIRPPAAMLTGFAFLGGGLLALFISAVIIFGVFGTPFRIADWYADRKDRIKRYGPVTAAWKEWFDADTYRGFAICIGISILLVLACLLFGYGFWFIFC